MLGMRPRTGVLLFAATLCAQHDGLMRTRDPLVVAGSVAGSTARASSPAGGVVPASAPHDLLPVFLSAVQREAGAAYAARSDRPGVLAAPNPRHGFDAVFSAAGVSLVAQPATRPAAGRAAGPANRPAGRSTGPSQPAPFTLAVTHLELDGASHPLATPSPSVDEGRVVFARRAASGESVTEWYVNGPLGLQQGFTLDWPSSGSAASVALDMTLAAGWHAKVAAEGRAATLDGPEPLSFGPLLAWDASGRALEARMVSRAGGLRYEVDTRRASWPVTIDPFLRYLRFAPSDLLAFDAFGGSVDIDGDTAVVGAPNVDIGSGSSQGAAYVFTRNATTGAWAQNGSRLTAPAPYNVDGANFGDTVVVDGDWMAISADGDNEGIIPRVFVYRRSGTSWYSSRC